MAWTTPKTWVAGNTLKADELNEQVRDNLSFLYAKPGAQYIIDEAANYSTSSLSFVDVDATDLTLALSTGGGDVLIWLTNAFLTASSRNTTYFDVAVNGSRLGGPDGICADTSFSNVSGGALGANQYASIGFVWLATGLSAGSNTFALQWKVNAFATTWYVGAGTSGADMTPQFGVREL